jgi:hypothetical protein
MNPQRFDRFSYAGSNPLKNKDPTGLSFDYYDPECEALRNNDGNPPQDPEPEDPGSSAKSRTEKCQDCTCKDRVDIKGLRKLKRDLLMGEIGIASAYTILCGIIGLVICGPAAVGCSLIGAAVCGIATYLLIDYTIDDAINDIHSLMEDLGCYCASYC